MSHENKRQAALYLQRLPEGTFRLIRGDKFADHLFFEDTKTHQVLKVPNAWYNHPVEWRIEHFAALAGEYEKQAEEIKKLAKPGWEKQFESLMKIAKECSEMAAGGG